MTLREMAERAATKVCSDCPMIIGGYGPAKIPQIADAIERVAKEFAELALRMSYKTHVFGITMDQAIPLAIAAAERGETDAVRDARERGRVEEIIHNSFDLASETYLRHQLDAAYRKGREDERAEADKR